MVKAPSRKVVERPIVYPGIETEIRMEGYDGAITVEEAKKMLGWEEENVANQFGDRYCKEIFDLFKRKIRLNNNVNNRPIYKIIILSLKQEILRKKWQLNGETIIIGRSSLILNGQHSLIALIAASEEWKTCFDWQQVWKTEPTIDKIMAYGIDESDEVVNTIDTAKPRSVFDVICRSDLFRHMDQSSKYKAARICDFGLRLVWERTGAAKGSLGPIRTRSESMGFIYNHIKLIDCTHFIMKELALKVEKKDHEEGQKVSDIPTFIFPGYAAGLLYLMGSSSTDPVKYRQADERSQEHLNWSYWDTACEFWHNISHGDNSVPKEALIHAQEKNPNGTVSPREKLSILVNAWNSYIKHKGKMKLEEIDLHYQFNQEYGVNVLIGYPSVGGIDYGDPSDADEADIKGLDPTVDQIEALAEKEREKRDKEEQAKKDKNKKQKPVSKYSNLAKEALVWVTEESKEPWAGRVVSVSPEGVVLKVETGHPGAGTKRTVSLKLCHTKQPGKVSVD